MRTAVSEMNDGEIRPTDVESPMWTTARHDVFDAGEAAGADEAAVVAGDEVVAADVGADGSAAAGVVAGLVVGVAPTVVLVDPVAVGPPATPVVRVLAPQALSARASKTKSSRSDEDLRGRRDGLCRTGRLYRWPPARPGHPRRATEAWPDRHQAG
jgi:hypothetical protein